MSFVELTDEEVAVLIDAADLARQELPESPNLDSLLAKINGLMRPETRGLTVAIHRLAPFSDEEIVHLACALDEDAERWAQL